MSLYEVGMLISFGASWPFAIVKTYKTKSVKSISIVFLLLLLFGYICGVLHKIFFSPDYVIFFYGFNGLLVLTELILYFMYKNNA